MRRTLALGGALVLAGLALLLALGHGSGGPATAAGAQAAARAPTAGDGFEPVLGLPATSVVVLGSAHETTAGETTWAYGTLGDVPASVGGASYADQVALLEHTEASGWQVVPLPSRPEGKPLGSGADSSSAVPYALGALGARVTPVGGVVLLTPGGIVARDPGGAPRLIPAPGSGEGGEKPLSELLGKGESLPPAAAPSGAGTPYAAIDEAGGRTGVLIAPYGDDAGAEGSSPAIAGPGVLRYDGEAWTREAISWKGSREEDLTPQALACGPAEASESSSSPENCWLLASYRSGVSVHEPNRLALFRRARSAGEPSVYTWERVKVADWLLGEAPPPAGVKEPANVATLGASAQTLTVTAQGVWVDFQAKIDGSPTATDISELLTPPAAAGESAGVAGHWCFGAAAPGCEPEHTLESPLPAQYLSFAWPGGSSGEGVGGNAGTRVITGLQGGALLELYGGSFHYEIGPGGDGGGLYGAALSLSAQGALEAGWIGEGGGSAYDDQGTSPLIHIAPQSQIQGDQLQEQPLPFRHPLLALAQAPGTAPGEAGAAAIAVGLDGEIGRYTPGQGWSSESLYNSAGEAQTPTLRGVAWPEADRAYAVGDDGAMWLWRAETGLWEPDPATPYNFIGNLTGIAFSPGEPQVGYAVGKQGVLLSYGKSWEEISASECERLKGELGFEEQQLNFTSIAFAGGQALTSYRVVVEERVETGGLLVNEENGSGWRVDASAAKLLARLPVSDTVLSKVAGLPDGGAVAAGPGLVIERESVGAEWRFSAQPLPEAQNVSALAAYREAGGPVRAVVSIDLDRHLNPNTEDLRENAFSGDLPAPSGPGQPPPRLSPDPLPSSGYVLKETAAGWEDMEHKVFEETDGSGGDGPMRPDPALALLVNPDGSVGLAVGGQTGDVNGALNGSTLDPDFETAAAMRFGAGAPAAGVTVTVDGEPHLVGVDTPAPIATTAGEATFAAGGEAACEHPCANFANEQLGPDVLLENALASARHIDESSPGALRGFLYTGDRVVNVPSSLGAEASKRELERYAGLLGGGGSLPVYAAASPKDLALGGGTLSPFTAALAPFLPSVAPGGDSAYYAETSPGGASGGPVRVIVLDFSTGTLGVAQEKWLAEELERARTEGPGKEGYPAIVVGNASLDFTLPDRTGDDPEPVQAQDAAAVSEILCKDDASAYLFDYPGVNADRQVGCDGRTPLPELGTGTLGYSSPPSSYQTDSLGSSGFMLVEVDTARRDSATNLAPVTARVVPNISQLALQATEGVLLHRSRAGLFEALARIPLSGKLVGVASSGKVQVYGPEPYEPIPFDCLGANCAYEVPAQYTFTSSEPDVGGFVEHETASADANQVRLGADGKPVPDEPRDAGGELNPAGRFDENAKQEPVNENGEAVVREQSALFCAYNEGTTVVSITAGGLTYSMPVTVQNGSSEYPCGTVPLKNPPPRAQPASAGFPIPSLAPQAPAPLSPQIQALVPPPPPKPPVHHVVHQLPPVPLAPAVLFPVLPLLPPPAPNVARPTPPSGTASVSQQVGVAEQEREQQGATEVSHHMVAYRHPEEDPLGAWPLGLILIAVAAGVGIRRGGRSPAPVLARASSAHRDPRSARPR